MNDDTMAKQITWFLESEQGQYYIDTALWVHQKCQYFPCNFTRNSGHCHFWLLAKITGTITRVTTSVDDTELQLGTSFTADCTDGHTLHHRRCCHPLPTVPNWMQGFQRPWRYELFECIQVQSAPTFPSDVLYWKAKAEQYSKTRDNRTVMEISERVKS